MASSVSSRLIRAKFLIGCAALILGWTLLSVATAEEAENTKAGRAGSRPLPGDLHPAYVCERHCINRCYRTGSSGYLGIYGCFRYCDCRAYLV